jgi:tungstate transport system ATP-binding protein
MVFQRPFMLRLSVWNNVRVALWLADRTMPRALRDGRADEALRRVGLGDLRDRPARSLSGGEQQRLALARGWAVRPGILFLDEPTASLDPSAKNHVEALLADFAADRMTLVMSTHNLGQARRLASRVIFMDQGRIGIDLPTAEFFAADTPGRAGLFLKGELSWLLDG